VPAAPQVGLAVAARVLVILLEEGAQAAPGPEMDYRFRGKGKGAIEVAQAVIKDQVLAIVQPLRIAARGLPGHLAKGHRPAGG
jgi:hypothetical protein